MMLAVVIIRNVMITIISIIAIFFYILGFLFFSGMYCGMEFNKTKDLLICIFYPITMWFVR